MTPMSERVAGPHLTQAERIMGRLSSIKPKLQTLRPKLAQSARVHPARQTAHPFSTRRGRKVRDAVLLRDLFTCQMCGCIVRAGRTDGRSAVVDHVRPWTMRRDLWFEPSNLRTVCKDCHAVCRSIEMRYAGNEAAIVAAKLAIAA